MRNGLIVLQKDQLEGKQLASNNTQSETMQPPKKAKSNFQLNFQLYTDIEDLPRL